jgi:hypothetical protein
MPKTARLGTVTIANAATQGSIVSSDHLAAAKRVLIHGPATLAETITVQGAAEVVTAAADLRNLKYNGGAAITFTGPTIMVVEWAGGRSISLVAGAGVAGQKDFAISAEF